MDNVFAQIKTTELKGSTFRSRILDFGDFDISDAEFKIVFKKAGNILPLTDFAPQKFGNTLVIPYNILESYRGEIRTEVWMTLNGVTDLALVDIMLISAENSLKSDATNQNISVTFGNVVIPVTFTQAIVNIGGGNGTGENGKSAYEIAVENGFVGTEPEWLISLKGADGEDFTYEDFTPEQLVLLKGEKGDSFEYADFTPEQLESLKGEPGYTPQKNVDYFDGEKGEDGLGYLGTQADVTNITGKTGFIKVTTPGTFLGITFTAAELNSNFGYINVANGVASKELSLKTTADIPLWTAKSYPISSLVYHDDGIYRNNAVTAVSEIPKTSSKWVLEHPLATPILEPFPIATFQDLTWKKGFLISEVNGAETASASWSYSENYIPVTANTMYTLLASGKSVAWYDADKVFISVLNTGIENSIKTVLSPANASFVRVSYLNANLEQFRIFKSNSNNLIVKTDSIQVKSLGGLKRVTPKIITTSFNITWKKGFVLLANGNEAASGSWSYGENYIPVTGGLFYTMPTAATSVIWYDSANNYISSSGGNLDAYQYRTFQAPANAAYMRVNQTNIDKPTFIIYEGKKTETFWIPEMTIKTSQVQKFSNEAEVTKGIAAIYDFSANPIAGNVIISGDSTIQTWAGGTALASILTATGTMTNIAKAGDTTAQQRTAYNGLTAGVKNDANVVFIQVGLNDLNPSDTTANIITGLQSYINDVNTASPNAKIIVGAMIPCYKRLVNLHGANAVISQKQWEEVNWYIGNKMLANIDISAINHVEWLSDEDGNLAKPYDTGDGIHENTDARRIIAISWLMALKK